MKYPFYFVTAFLSLFFSTRTGCKLAGGGDVAPPFRKFKASFLDYNKAFLHLISEVGATHKLVIRMLKALLMSDIQESAFSNQSMYFLYPETLEVPIRGRVQLRILELGDEAGEKQKKKEKKSLKK